MKELPKLYEIYIYDKAGSGSYKVIDDMKWWDYIKEINSDILYKDNHWHYFYERYYLIVRCQKRFVNKIHKFLDKKNIEYEDNGRWWDGALVESYKEIFQPLFHNFTKLALLGYTDKDRSAIVDRVIHCFLNHQFYNFEDVRNEHGYYSWESQVIVSNAMDRALHQGRIWQDDLLQIEKDKRDKKKKETADGDGKSSSGNSDGG
jgi:hypothetical protein